MDDLIYGTLFVIGLFLYGAVADRSATRQRRNREERQLEDAEHRRLEWENETEPQNRRTRGYPPDWQTRRTSVFFRENGRCQSCGARAGRCPTTRESRWRHPKPKVVGAHVHHRLPIRKGGTHALDNLELLCDSCHLAKHPQNTGLRLATGRRRVQRMAVGRDAKVKRARKRWLCEGCERPIESGEEYFGGRYATLCLECGSHHRRFPRVGR